MSLHSDTLLTLCSGDWRTLLGGRLETRRTNLHVILTAWDQRRREGGKEQRERGREGEEKQERRRGGGEEWETREDAREKRKEKERDCKRKSARLWRLFLVCWLFKTKLSHYDIMLCSSEVKRTTSAAGVAQRKLVLRGTTTKKSKRRATWYAVDMITCKVWPIRESAGLNRQFITKLVSCPDPTLPQGKGVWSLHKVLS